ncbi:MAG: hypothetical protein M3P38_00720 [Chloroflexota bacterium]|nr:hypothetical protein [Chloroflexota bacterium]
MTAGTHAVWRLPHASQECEQGPEAHLVDRTLTIRYDFENEAGNYEWASFRFEGVVAVTFVDAELSSPDQIAALDTVLEVEQSDWLEKAKDARRFGKDQRYHYRIYFDDYGCYEVLSERFSPSTDDGS